MFKLKQWWGIRHLRYVYYTIQVNRFAWSCYQHGLGMGVPNESDVAHLEDIWKGKA